MSIRIGVLAIVAVLATGCASSDEMSSLRSEVLKTQEIAREAQASAQAAATEARKAGQRADAAAVEARKARESAAVAADEARSVSAKAEKVFQKSLRK